MSTLKKKKAKTGGKNISRTASDAAIGLKAVSAVTQGLRSSGKGKGGLGRGLDALIARKLTKSVADGGSAPQLSGKDSAYSGGSSDGSLRNVIDVGVEFIVSGQWQPRSEFDEESLKGLAESIRTHGIIQPLICRPPINRRYELIGGERRLRAALMAGLKTVPVIVMETEDRTAAELSLVENLQREDLNILDEAEGYKTLADTFGMTQADIAGQVGKARATVANALRILSLPDEVKELLRTAGSPSGEFTPGHAKVLLGLSEESDMVKLASDCVRRGWSVRALEDRVRRLSQSESRPAYAADIPKWYLNDLCDKLRLRFKTAVRLVPNLRRKNGAAAANGRIEIEFANNDDLSRLLELMGIDVNETT